MKKAIIAHRWSGNAEGDWYPWLKKELQAQGFQVHVPEILNPDQPTIEHWQEALKKTISLVDADTIFVGHSIGCQAILRFLEKQPKGQKAGAVLLVAPWLELKNLEEDAVDIAKPWLETPIDFPKVRSSAQQFFALFSDNDPYVAQEQEAQFQKNLGAQTQMQNSKGHFTQDDGVEELPIILEKVQEYAQPPMASYDDFMRLVIKIGTITQAEKVDGADKLLKLTVDLGEEEPRTICAGIAQWYSPEEIVGKQAPFLANLAPRKLRGIESAGMTLMTENKDKKPIFLSPEIPVEPGSEIR